MNYGLRIADYGFEGVKNIPLYLTTFAHLHIFIFSYFHIYDHGLNFSRYYHGIRQ